ncbi:MAG: cupin domain-containing protein [Magnetovibrio sp.]|nr:cupin domain-containing protein [Magnetovibrio sp.]
MQIHADFNVRAVVRPGDVEWVPSPESGVDRLMLDRLGDEVARATTLVRFAPDSFFPEHLHTGGEEYLVLEGVFCDESGDYGPGTYVRNPMGTKHKPFTKDGALILVKLWQFQDDDKNSVHIDTQQTPFSPGLVNGLSVLPLHQFKDENVALVRWQPGTHFSHHSHPGGEEIYVIEGTFQDEHGRYPVGTWVRNPNGSPHTPFSDEGCLIYVKTGHLRAANPTLSAPDQRG